MCTSAKIFNRVLDARTWLIAVTSVTRTVLTKEDETRNQYASPPRGNAIPAGPLSDFLSDFYKSRRGEGIPGP